jgi:hypothetical protein
MIKYKDLKKNDQIKTNQLLGPVNKEMPTGKLLESPKQGRGLKRTILIWCNGDEIGYFSEAGSVYAHQVQKVFRDGAWHQVIEQPKTQDQDAMLDQLATQ